jgi:hypothetical protein
LLPVPPDDPAEEQAATSASADVTAAPAMSLCVVVLVARII